MALTDASLSQPVISAAVLLFADFVDLPIRVAYAKHPIYVPNLLSGGDAQCWDEFFETVDDRVLQIGPVNKEQGGSSPLTITFTGDPSNPELLEAIEDPALYAGRTVRLWIVLHSQGTATEIVAGYRGYMTLPGQDYDPGSFTVTMQAENYLALLSAAPARTYLAQSLYDAGDQSALVSMGSLTAAPGFDGGAVDFGGGLNLNMPV